MANKTIYPKGAAEFTVPASQSVAISNYGGGIAQIYYLIESANAPDAFQLQQTLENGAVVLGPFTAETVVRIEANNSKVIYDVGASPDTGIGDADTLNGLAGDTADTADTIAARDGSGDITANAFESTVATGTPPMVVSSTTVVTNFNADTVDGIQGADIAKNNVDNLFSASQTVQRANPFFQTDETDTLTTMRIGTASGVCYIYAGASGGYTQGSGDFIFAGYGSNVDINSLKVRYGGADQDIYHTGIDSNLAKIDATSGALQLPTLASDPASGASNGQMYYNTTSHVIRAYINGSWVDNT